MVASTSGPITVIIGSTGAQGSSVLKHLKDSNKPYSIRAVTRDATKDSAKALKEDGVEVVQGDVSKSEDLKRLFDGAKIVFAVTNFWEHMDGDKELADGKAIVDAAKAAGVDLLLWSALEPVKKVSGGKLTHVLHFDVKAEITDYAKSSGVPLAVVQAGCYDSNFLTMMAPKKNEDGSYAFYTPVSPKTVYSLVDTQEDYGAYVRAAIEKYGAGSETLACTEEITMEEIAKTWSEVTGKQASVVQIPHENFLSFMPAPMNQEFLDMLIWFQDYGYYGGKDIKPSQKGLAGPVTTWRQFVEKNKSSWE